jgi:hypothetical protein
MTKRLIGLTLFLAVLAPAAVPAGPPPADATEGRVAMYENVEIMRRLLSSKLHVFAGNSATRWLTRGNTSCMVCHDTAHEQLHGKYLGLTANAGQRLVFHNKARFLAANSHAGEPVLYFNQGRDRLEGHTRMLLNVMPSMLDIEGTYLKSQGVVFSLTLPPPARDPRPEAPKPAPQPPSDWERIRREVRQEKEPEQKADTKKEPTLAEVVLRALADNGKHFTQLGANESLTVVITFRADSVAQGVALIDYGMDGWPDLYVAPFIDSGTVQAPPEGQQSAEAAKPQASPADDAAVQKIKDLILLGELHAKQGKIEEAIQALQQAVKLKPEGDQAREALRKLAATLLVAGKDAEAEQVMKQFSVLTAKQPEKAAPKADPQKTSLPAKLIITASKKLLDQVAAGTITFEEFQKAATVDYLTFAAP